MAKCDLLRGEEEGTLGQRGDARKGSRLSERQAAKGGGREASVGAPRRKTKAPDTGRVWKNRHGGGIRKKRGRLAHKKSQLEKNGLDEVLRENNRGALSNLGSAQVYNTEDSSPDPFYSTEDEKRGLLGREKHRSV